VSDEKLWEVIERAQEAGKHTQPRIESIRAQLDGLDAAALARFEAAYLGWFNALERFDLRAAVSTLMGGLSDSGFKDFRAWLILQGRAAVEQAIADPDVLAGWKYVESPETEGLSGMARSRSEELFGSFETLAFQPDTTGWSKDRLSNRSPTPAERARLFPRISAKPLSNRQKMPRSPAPSSYEQARREADGRELPYSRSTRFVDRALLKHASFGIGVVTAVRGDRIDVIFPTDARKVLLHKS
jgi:hypothetical protein